MKRVANAPRRVALALTLAAVCTLVTATAARAQVVTVDEATFELTRGGEVIGEERVILRRTGVGRDARIIGQSEILMADGSEMRPRLEATALFRATTYQNRFSGAEEGEVQVTRAGRRLLARTASSAGEAQREFPASDRTLLLETEVILLYYLVRPWAEVEEATLTVLDPRSSRQIRMSVRVAGSEEVRVGRDLFSTSRVRLEAGDDVREVWLDADGRVLRVEVPHTGFSARRTSR
jgi:hypothetical protein